MKRPRPVNSAESSTRGIDCPTHGELESLLANASLAKASLAASAIPQNPPPPNDESGEFFKSRRRWRPYQPISKLTIPSHFRDVQCSISSRDGKYSGTRAG